jgi:hypothetical protein
MLRFLIVVLAPGSQAALDQGYPPDGPTDIVGRLVGQKLD